MIEPGWYPAPNQPGKLRWWDGQTWTQHFCDDPEAAIESGLVDQVSRLRAELETLQRDVVQTREILALQEVGIYQYSHPLENAVAFKDRLEVIEGSIRDTIKAGKAVVGTTQWAINGSQKEGAKMVNDFCKLLLRAYNNEADNTVRALKPFMIANAIQRLEKARATIQKLGLAMKIEVSDEFHRLRVQELKLTADYLAKREDEREKEREARARMREKAIEDKERAEKKERLEKERAQIEISIELLRAKGDEKGLAKMATKLVDVNKAIADVDAREANESAGFVYCISNIGAFGSGVVKIGMTRREEPMDRVRELGGASVPFHFDLHALFYADNAFAIETDLHHRFRDRAVNLKNNHKEFFLVTPSEVRDAMSEVARKTGIVLEFKEVPVAEEWRESESQRRKLMEANPPPPTGAPRAK